MAIPLIRGKPYYATFSATINPTENGTITINIGPRYSFSPGNTVIVSNNFNSLLRFEAIVTSYDSTSGDMTLDEITNIKSGAQGTWPQTGPFNISLAGQRGSTIMATSTNPDSNVGRPGDLHINTSTGEVYIKS